MKQPISRERKPSHRPAAPAKTGDTRQQVLELIGDSHQPLTAYQLLEALRQKRGAPVQPPTIYRALNALVEQGLVHRLESLNAFVACADHSHTHASQFAICGKCGKTQELFDEKVAATLRKQAAAIGFAASSQTIELRGLCAGCRQN